MRKIVTAVSAAALSLSMLASAGPALAVVGYDSAYAGESAFVNISPGQTQNFQVFFVNTGTTTWTRGTGTQVDLAACLFDKVTCDAQDASEAPWNSGWISATRYATTTQTTTAPGALATFSYNITAPGNATAGTYRFNGDLVLSTTGEKIHPEGYFQDATIGGPGSGAATLTSIAPTSGTSAGGTPVTLTGSGIVCTPAFPSVSFGGTIAVVTSCGSTSVGATSPAHAPGAVTVTLTNSGQAASNGLTFTFTDEADPVYTSLTVSGEFATVTFSEPVCRVGAFAATDWTVNNVSAATTNVVQSDSIPTCDAEFDNGVTSAVLDLTTPMPNGAFVEATLNTRGAATTDSDNEAIRDQAGNFVDAPQSRQATATAPETTAPVLTSASGAVGSQTITLNFSEPVRCGAGLDPTGGNDFTLSDNNSATTDPTITAFGTNPCGSSPTTADTSFSLTTSTPLPSDRTYTVTVTAESGDIEDVVGNDLANPSSVTFTTGAGDFTPPTIIDARMVNNLITTDFTEAGDSFSATFSEVMETTTTGDSLQIQDLDGTVFTLNCGVNVSCTWNTAGTTVTVTITTTITPPAVGDPGAGNTPGMQIPFDITTLSGFMDLQGNVPNVGNSSDRRVDFE